MLDFTYQRLSKDVVISIFEPTVIRQLFGNDNYTIIERYATRPDILDNLFGVGKWHYPFYYPNRYGIPYLHKDGTVSYP